MHGQIARKKRTNTSLCLYACNKLLKNSQIQKGNSKNLQTGSSIFWGGNISEVDQV